MAISVYNIDMTAKKTSRARKVWIFKWLLKKNGCKGISLEKDFFFKDRSKRIDFFKVVLCMDNGKTLMLMVDRQQDRNFKRTIMVPYRYNISYADVLDGILEEMKKNDSDCWMMSNSWPNRRTSTFLKKDVTMEELEIEFDLS